MLIDIYATKPKDAPSTTPYCAVPHGRQENLPPHPSGADWTLVKVKAKAAPASDIAAGVTADGHYLIKASVTSTEGPTPPGVFPV